MIATRPDLVHSLSVVSRFIGNLGKYFSCTLMQISQEILTKEGQLLDIFYTF